MWSPILRVSARDTPPSRRDTPQISPRPLTPFTPRPRSSVAPSPLLTLLPQLVSESDDEPEPMCATPAGPPTRQTPPKRPFDEGTPARQTPLKRPFDDEPEGPPEDELEDPELTRALDCTQKECYS